jgi:Short C-terminal domain
VVVIEPIPGNLERALNAALSADETVTVKLKGAYSEALVCTSTRVIVLKSGWMTGQWFGTDMFQCPYSNVAGAQVNFHLLTGYFELSAGGMQNTRKSFWNRDESVNAAKAPNCVSIAGPERAARFREACAFIMHKTSVGHWPIADSPLRLLEQLAKLRDSGAISATEYQVKKAELLSRL